MAVPPGGGADAVRLQCFAVGGDRVFLGLGQAAAVDGQVPGQVAERRAAAGLLPVQQDRAALIVGAEVVELPVAVDERLRGRGQGGDERAGVVRQGGDYGGGGRGDLGEQGPALGDEFRDQVRGAGGGLGFGRPWGQLQVAVHDGNDVELGAAVPELRVQGGHVPQKPRVLVPGYGLVGGGDQPAGDVVHQEGAAAGFRGGADDRLVEAAGQAGQDAALPE